MCKSKVLILGMSNDEKRNSFLASRYLQNIGHSIIVVPSNQTTMNAIQPNEILDDSNCLKTIETISIYLPPIRQKKFYKTILELKPKRIIFNPGYENLELASLAKKQNIETYFGCTIALFSMGAI